MSADVCRQFVTAIEMYRQAVEILQWGREKWKDVSSEERGSMFELTYIRGVKRMYMTTLVEVCTSREFGHHQCTFLIFIG